MLRLIEALFLAGNVSASETFPQIHCFGEYQNENQQTVQENYQVFWGSKVDFTQQPERVDVLRKNSLQGPSIYNQSFPYFGDTEAPLTGPASLGLWKITNHNFSIEFDYKDYCWETTKNMGTNWRFKARVSDVHPGTYNLVCYADPSFDYPHMLGPNQCD